MNMSDMRTERLFGMMCREREDQPPPPAVIVLRVLYLEINSELSDTKNNRSK
jgi:hypothetical protein